MLFVVRRLGLVAFLAGSLAALAGCAEVKIAKGTLDGHPWISKKVQGETNKFLLDGIDLGDETTNACACLDTCGDAHPYVTIRFNNCYSLAEKLDKYGRPDLSDWVWKKAWERWQEMEMVKGRFIWLEKSKAWEELWAQFEEIAKDEGFYPGNCSKAREASCSVAGYGLRALVQTKRTQMETLVDTFDRYRDRSSWSIYSLVEEIFSYDGLEERQGGDEKKLLSENPDLVNLCLKICMEGKDESACGAYASSRDYQVNAEVNSAWELAREYGQRSGEAAERESDQWQADRAEASRQRREERRAEREEQEEREEAAAKRRSEDIRKVISTLSTLPEAIRPYPSGGSSSSDEGGEKSSPSSGCSGRSGYWWVKKGQCHPCSCQQIKAGQCHEERIPKLIPAC